MIHMPVICDSMSLPLVWLSQIPIWLHTGLSHIQPNSVPVVYAVGEQRWDILRESCCESLWTSWYQVLASDLVMPEQLPALAGHCNTCKACAEL